LKAGTITDEELQEAAENTSAIVGMPVKWMGNPLEPKITQEVKQVSLFGEEPKQPKKTYDISLKQDDVEPATLDFVDGKPVTERKRQRLEEDSKYTDAYCYNEIRTATYLWDMRCWNERSEEEAREWVKSLRDNYPNSEHKNSGHTRWCIKKLLARGTEIDLIVAAMMENHKLQYRNREVKCFGEVFLENRQGKRCSTWTEEKGYSETNCERCQ